MKNKKRLIIAAIAIVCTCLFCIGGIAATEAIVESRSYGIGNAVEKVIAESGLTEDEVTVLKAKLTLSNGEFVYDVKVAGATEKYDYTLRASDGKILESEKEITGKKPSSPSTSVSIPQTSEPPVADVSDDTSVEESTVTVPVVIGLERAKEIALADSGAKEVTFTKTILTTDDKRQVYEIDFRDANGEYDYEIDAYSGEITEKDFDLFPAVSAAPETSESVVTLITLSEAKAIALKDAGLSDADFLKAYLDRDDAREVYEIEFVNGNTEYDYEIDAQTGKITERSTEKKVTPEVSKDPIATYISVDKAKEIALSDAGVTDAVFTSQKLDKDDGRAVYEIDFYTNEAEYDYEINALTGTIVEKSREAHKVNGETSTAAEESKPGSKYIGVDAAKKIALEHAKVTSSAAVFRKAKLEFDDGRYTYEIEFYVGRTEYECEIDAINGNIIDFETDTDD